jgi:hypothetical protein
MQISGVSLEPVLNVLSLPLVQILFVCFVFGGFGGCVAHWINNERQQSTARREGLQERRGDGQASTAQPWFLYPSGRQSAGIGAAGALAFLFFVIAVGGLTNFQTLTEQLRSIAVSVIAGFGARRLLPRMVGHLEKQMEEVKNEAEKASHDAKEALGRQRETDRRVRSLELNTKLLGAADESASEGSVEEVLRLFEEARRDGSAEPFIWLNGARLQRRRVSLDVAIKTLDDFLTEIHAGRLKQDANYPGAYFNRGCYHWLRFEKSRNAADQDLALKDLEACLRNTKDPIAWLAEMRRDKDLKGLVELSTFKALTETYEHLQKG